MSLTIERPETEARLIRFATSRGLSPLDALTALVKADAMRPQAEALLDALRRAMPYAEALDDKHGHSCWSDDLGDVIGKLTLQIHGPDCGGRE